MTELEEERIDGGQESSDIVALMSALPNSTKSKCLARVCAMLHRLHFVTALWATAQPGTIMSKFAAASLMVFNEDDSHNHAVGN